jgi:hypothetical protein
MTKARLLYLLVIAALFASLVGCFRPTGMNDGGWWI